MKANINDLPLRIRDIPKRYIRPNGRTIDRYDLRTDLHNEDGWRDVITPSYNTETQILGGLIIFEDTITYQVIDLTQEEIDARDEDEAENEAGEKMREHIEKGVKLHTKSYRKVWRKVVKNEQLTKSKGRKLFRWLKPTWRDLNNGDFKEASKSISDVLIDNEIELQTEPIMFDVLEWFEGLINDYKDNKYDL